MAAPAGAKAKSSWQATGSKPGERKAAGSVSAATAGRASLMEPVVAAKLAGLGERVAAGRANAAKPRASV